MAVIKPSALISDIRGKLGRDMVFGIWKGKNWVRTSAPSAGNPASDLQRPIRQAVTRLVHKWKNELTQAQKDGWDQAASDLTSASAQYAAMESTLRNGMVKMAADDASVESGVNLFLGTNLGRIQAVTPSGVLVQDPAAQVLPDVRVVEDAPPAALLFDPQTVEDFTAVWDPAGPGLDVTFTTPADPSVDVPTQDLIDGQQFQTELYLRLGDPRFNRLRSFTGAAWATAVAPAQILTFWRPGGTSGSPVAWPIGAHWRVAARVRSCYGRLSPWSNVVAFDSTPPP